MKLIEHLAKYYDSINESNVDRVSDKEAAMNFDDLDDRDLDNDGDSDESDEYLHKRLGKVAKMDETNVANEASGWSKSALAAMSRVPRNARFFLADEDGNVLERNLKTMSSVLAALNLAAKEARSGFVNQAFSDQVYGKIPEVVNVHDMKKDNKVVEQYFWDPERKQHDGRFGTNPTINTSKTSDEFFLKGKPVTFTYDTTKQKSPRHSSYADRDWMTETNESDELEEMSSTASAPGYQTPYAFGDTDDDTYEQGGMKRVKKTNKIFKQMEGKSTYKKMMSEMYGVDATNESISYREYKRDESASPSQKVNKSIHEVNRMLAEIEKIIQNNLRLKTETGVRSNDFWKSTSSRFAKINERMVRISNRLKELSK